MNVAVFVGRFSCGQVGPSDIGPLGWPLDRHLKKCEQGRFANLANGSLREGETSNYSEFRRKGVFLGAPV